MVPLTNRIGAAFIVMLFTACPGGTHTVGKARADSLFSQTAAESLEREFPSRDISFLAVDVRSGHVLASRWEDSDRPIPLGSLVKPFAALAYGEHHDFRFPAHTCRGTASGCWRAGGHGTLDLTAAIAYSCNSYFRALTTGLDASWVSTTALRFGLEPPHGGTSGPALAGMGAEWRIAPLHMAEAYIELAHERQQPSVGQILDGMAESARYGTAAEVNRGLQSTRALAKTGTALCTHEHHAPGDGFTIALFPAETPRVLLMVRVHGVPGAVAAKTAGQMLHRIEQ